MNVPWLRKNCCKQTQVKSEMSCTRNLFGGSENMLFVNSTTFQIKAKRNWTSFLWNRSGLVGEWARGDSDQLSEFLNTFALHGDDIKVDSESREKFKFFILKFNSRKLFMQNDFAHKSIWGKALALSLAVNRLPVYYLWGERRGMLEVDSGKYEADGYMRARESDDQSTFDRVRKNSKEKISHNLTLFLTQQPKYCRSSTYIVAWVNDVLCARWRETSAWGLNIHAKQLKCRVTALLLLMNNRWK